MPNNFVVIGVDGFIASRHLRTIRDTGNLVIVVVNPKDFVCILDKYIYDVKFITEIEPLTVYY